MYKNWFIRWHKNAISIMEWSCFNFNFYHIFSVFMTLPTVISAHLSIIYYIIFSSKKYCWRTEMNLLLEKDDFGLLILKDSLIL